MSIKGLGTDIIEVQRVLQAIKRNGQRFIDRIFTLREQAYCSQYADSQTRYAGRFAAKEAIAKAFGVGFGKELAFHDVEIINNVQGKPEVFLFGKKEEGVMISISHNRDYAIATAINCMELSELPSRSERV